MTPPKVEAAVGAEENGLTKQELIDRMWANRMRYKAIEGTDADPLVQLERMIAEDERRHAAYLRSQRWRLLSPFPWHWK
jgi:hypothetical protein